MNRTLPKPCLQASPANSLSGHLVVPGDKSISHRALILGALANGRTTIDGLLESRDLLDTAAALRAFGIRVDRGDDGLWTVDGGEWRTPDTAIDCGNSGTAARLLIGAAAGFPIEASFTGDASLRGRPMRRIVAPLRRMGATIDGEMLPIRLRGGALRGICHVNETASAQVKSAVLLAGLRAEGEVEVIEPRASRDHSETMLRNFGCAVEVAPCARGLRIALGARRRLTAAPVQVPGDPSSAAFALVAALIVPGGDVTVHNVLVNPLRCGLFETLGEMGADLTIANRRWLGGEPVADLTARSSRLRGVAVPAERAPRMIDEYPILAVAAAFADGETRMHGLGELRVKESDRLAAVVVGLRACGVDAAAVGDALRVRGRGGAPRGGAAIPTCGDHRIAMAFLTLGLGACAPVAVDRPEMIATSFPGFAASLASLGAIIAEPALSR